MSMKHYTGLRHARQGATYRKRIQTGEFQGIKKTYWHEYDRQGNQVGSYWGPDVPNAPVRVYYD